MAVKVTNIKNTKSANSTSSKLPQKLNQHYQQKHKLYYYLAVITSILIVLIFGSLILIDGIPFDFSDEDESTVEIVDLAPLEEFETTSVQDINLPEGYTVQAAFTGIQNGNMKCQTKNNESCVIYLVVGSDNQTYVLSSPYIVKYNTSEGVEVEKKVADVAGTEVELNYYTLNTFDDEGNEQPSKVYLQINGCIGDNLCVNSGVFNYDIELNKKEVETFENFLRSLSR